MSDSLFTDSLQIEQAEVWKPVVGMEGFYEVSNLGRVRTLHKIGRACRKGIVEQTPNKKGYLRVHLTGNGRRFSSVVHRLVLSAFIGPAPSPTHECNHKDGVKSNNNITNLEWVTPVGNNRHARETGLWHPHIGEAHGRALVTEDDVRLIRSLEGDESPHDLARRYGVNVATIRAIWKRRNWKHVV